MFEVKDGHTTVTCDRCRKTAAHLATTYFTEVVARMKRMGWNPNVERPGQWLCPACYPFGPSWMTSQGTSLATAKVVEERTKHFYRWPATSNAAVHPGV